MKKINDIEFPVKYYGDNILFNQEHIPWGYYEVMGYEYDFLSASKKARISQEIESVFAKVGVETHLLILPKFHSVREKQERFKKTITGPLKEAAIRHTDEVIPLIENAVGSTAEQYHYYIGLKLERRAEDTELTIKNILQTYKDLLGELFSKFGMEDPDIPESEIGRVKFSEKMYFELLNKFSENIEVRRVDEDDYQWLIRRNFYRGICPPPLIPNFKPAYKETNKGTKKGRKPLSLLHLTEGNVDDFSEPRNLLISQVVDGELETSHSAFLTVSYMPTDGLGNIGTEWIYRMQSLSFFPDMSIRTDSMDYRKVMSTVRDKRKEINDQKDHAEKSNNQASREVFEASDLNDELEDFTSATKMPQINVSIVIGVSAATKEDLKIRVREVRNLYTDYFFQLEHPISDQFKLFNEFIPGAKRYSKSYVEMMEPAALAAGMFGATTQIGDDTGFCIGFSADGKPVLLNPWLYTQGGDETMSRSLSTVFLGSKGSGKSYGANLLMYLAILYGGKGLIIDPKNERTKWKEMLQYIPHEVNIITLEATESNKGRLDPFIMCKNLKDAENLALKICVYLTRINQQKERAEWIAIRKVVREVAAEPNPCMDKIVTKLLAYPEKTEGHEMGAYLETYQDLSFAQLLFGDGSEVDALNIDNALNILQIANLKLPDKDRAEDKFDLEEMLSMAMMFPIGEFTLQFVHQDKSILKFAFFDESWFMEKTDIGRDIISRIQREGRSWNAGLFRATQATKDIEEETRSLVGMKFVYQNEDEKEAANSLRFLGLDPTESLVDVIRKLKPGTCFMQDMYGRTGIVTLNAWFKDLDRCFDTRPPLRGEIEEIEEPMENKELVHS